MIVLCFSRNEEGIEILNNLDGLESTFQSVKCFDSNHDYPIYHYYIYIPLEFLKVGSVYDLDWGYLEKVWRKIYELLKD